MIENFTFIYVFIIFQLIDFFINFIENIIGLFQKERKHTLIPHRYVYIYITYILPIYITYIRIYIGYIRSEFIHGALWKTKYFLLVHHKRFSKA